MKRTIRAAISIVLAGSLLSIPLVAEAKRPPKLKIPYSAKCLGLYAFAPADPRVVQSHLPDGFVPAVPREATAIFPSGEGFEGAEAVVMIQGLSCYENWTATKSLSLGGISTFVEGPRSKPDGRIATYAWKMLLTDEDERARLTRFGLDVVEGDHSSLYEVEEGGIHSSSALVIGEAVDAWYSTRDAVSEQQVSFRLDQYQQAQNGLAIWRSVYTVPYAYEGTVLLQAEEGTFFTELFGDETIEARSLYSYYHQISGKLIIPL